SAEAFRPVGWLHPPLACLLQDSGLELNTGAVLRVRLLLGCGLSLRRGQRVFDVAPREITPLSTSAPKPSEARQIEASFSRLRLLAAVESIQSLGFASRSASSFWKSCRPRSGWRSGFCLMLATSLKPCATACRSSFSAWLA